MNRNIAVFGVVIGILFFVAAIAQPPNPSRQVTVYDASGKKVGDVVGAEYVWGRFLPQVSFNVDNTPFILYVFRDGFNTAEGEVV